MSGSYDDIVDAVAEAKNFQLNPDGFSWQQVFDLHKHLDDNIDAGNANVVVAAAAANDIAYLKKVRCRLMCILTDGYVV